MRFEIRSGGIAAILVGLFALSLAVFLLGVEAGYEIGLQNLASNAQTTTSYPLTPPAEENPPAAPAPSAAASVSAPVEAAPAPAPAAISTPVSAPNAAHAPARKFGAGAKPVAHKVAKSAAPKHAQPAAQETSAAAASPAAPAASPAEGGEAAETSPAEVPAPREYMEENPAAGNPAAPPEATPAGADTHPPHHKPYNIQIQAAMDLNGANRMMQRLQSLGYQPHLSPTEIGGQTWYRVEVGPYTTQEEAAAAEAALRQKYNATFGGGSPPSHSGD
jgi:hypothetical protein